MRLTNIPNIQQFSTTLHRSHQTSTNLLHSSFCCSSLASPARATVCAVCLSPLRGKGRGYCSRCTRADQPGPLKGRCPVCNSSLRGKGAGYCPARGRGCGVERLMFEAMGFEFGFPQRLPSPLSSFWEHYRTSLPPISGYKLLITVFAVSLVFFLNIIAPLVLPSEDTSSSPIYVRYPIPRPPTTASLRAPRWRDLMARRPLRLRQKWTIGCCVDQAFVVDRSRSRSGAIAQTARSRSATALLSCPSLALLRCPSLRIVSSRDRMGRAVALLRVRG